MLLLTSQIRQIIIAFWYHFSNLLTADLVQPDYMQDLVVPGHTGWQVPLIHYCLHESVRGRTLYIGYRQLPHRPTNRIVSSTFGYMYTTTPVNYTCRRLLH